MRVFWQVIANVSKYPNAFIFRVTQFLGLWSWRQRYYDRSKLTDNLFATRHGIISHKTRIFSNTALITWNLAYFFYSCDLCETKLWFIFPDDTIADRGRRSCDPCGGRFIRSAREIYIVSLLTALCRGTFTLKAVVGSQSVKQPRRFVLRTMIVLHSGWILHYSIRPLTIQWRERGSIGQAACVISESIDTSRFLECCISVPFFCKPFGMVPISFTHSPRSLSPPTMVVISFWNVSFCEKNLGLKRVTNSLPDPLWKRFNFIKALGMYLPYR